MMLAKKEICTGCGACAQICPKKSIVMKEDSEGFLYPSILEETCVNCGLCISVCTIANKTDYQDHCMSAYAAYAKDEAIRLKSSSGGIFSHLATHFMPDPELLIRTGGEIRLSNYLLWQCAYSELYFCDTFWPDFKEEEFSKAIYDYQRRERRFGKTSEQI